MTSLSKKILILTFLWIASSIASLEAQLNYVQVSSQWDDSFREWVIYSFDEEEKEIEHMLSVDWPDKNRWADWTIEHEKYSTAVRQKWKNKPDNWELRTPDLLLQFQPKWRNDYNEWTLNWDENKLSWKTVNTNNLAHWYFENKEFGVFEMFTINNGDPRDWEIIDETKNLPKDIKDGLIFIALYLTAPKR